MFHQNPDFNRRLIQHHQNDMMRDAEQHRLVRAAGKGALRRASLYQPLLIVLGKSMVELGTRLQGQYSSRMERLNEWTANESTNTASRIA
jgi:hypothetical protein